MYRLEIFTPTPFTPTSPVVEMLSPPAATRTASFAASAMSRFFVTTPAASIDRTEMYVQKGIEAPKTQTSRIAVGTDVYTETAVAFDATSIVNSYLEGKPLQREIRQIDQPFLRISESRGSEQLAPYPVNLHIQQLSKGDLLKYSGISSGAIASHREGPEGWPSKCGMSDFADSTTGQFRGPEELRGEFETRRTILECQSLAVLAAAVDATESYKIWTKGEFQLHSTSLLTPKGKERPMLQDMRWALNNLERRVQLQFDGDVGAPQTVTEGENGAIILHCERREGLDETALFSVKTSLFTLAVNEHRLFGGVDHELQQTINGENRAKLAARGGAFEIPARIDTIEDLRLANEAIRKNGATPHTCCKSGKDRSGAEIINAELRAANLEEKSTFEQFYSRGVRADICKVNIGDRRFAFNRLQRLLMDPLFIKDFPSYMGGASKT